MPVNIEGGQFRIIMKQPKQLYRTAWMLADMHEDETAGPSRDERNLNERIPLIRSASMQQ